MKYSSEIIRWSKREP